MDVWDALRKPCPHGLFYPEHVSKICPTERIKGRLCLTILPTDRLRACNLVSVRQTSKVPLPRSPVKIQLKTSNLVRHSSWVTIGVSSDSDVKRNAYQNIRSSSFPFAVGGKYQKNSCSG